jgi:hypothetical protein
MDFINPICINAGYRSDLVVKIPDPQHCLHRLELHKAKACFLMVDVAHNVDCTNVGKHVSDKPVSLKE